MEDSSSYSGEDELIEDIGYKNMTDKGKRMANSIAEYMLMRYFFPEWKIVGNTEALSMRF